LITPFLLRATVAVIVLLLGGTLFGLTELFGDAFADGTPVLLGLLVSLLGLIPLLFSGYGGGAGNLPPTAGAPHRRQFPASSRRLVVFLIEYRLSKK
jgi:hypothetical protein